MRTHAFSVCVSLSDSSVAYIWVGYIVHVFIVRGTDVTVRPGLLVDIGQEALIPVLMSFGHIIQTFYTCSMLVLVLRILSCKSNRKSIFCSYCSLVMKESNDTTTAVSKFPIGTCPVVSATHILATADSLIWIRLHRFVAVRGVAATALITLEFVAIIWVVCDLQELVQFINGLGEQRVQQIQVLENNTYENTYENKQIRGRVRN